MTDGQRLQNNGSGTAVLGLGLAALGRPGYITLGHATDLDHDYTVAGMAAHTHAMLGAAWQAGIRYFDAARSYGRAEEFLGAWLRSRTFSPRDRPVIGSKWGYTYTANWQVDAAQHEVKDHTLDVLQRQWQETNSHLGGFLNLYQIHSATFESGVLTRREVLSELLRLKQSGTLIGVTLSGIDQPAVLEAALQVEVDGVRLFDAVQATWNVLEPSCGPMLQAARAAGVSIIVKEALANGRLTPRNQAPGFSSKLALLDEIAMRHGATIDAVALAAAMQQPWTTVVLTGAATQTQLASNLLARQVHLTAADWTALTTLAESPTTYWQTRSNLAWN